jgi:hypothetical protein
MERGQDADVAEAVGAVIWHGEHDAYQRTDPDAGHAGVRP